MLWVPYVATTQMRTKESEKLLFKGRFRGLSFRFASEKPIDVLIGPNGSGKTTLIEAMSFALAPLDDLDATIRHLDYLTRDFLKIVRGDHVSALLGTVGSHVEVDLDGRHKLELRVEGNGSFPLQLKYKLGSDEFKFQIHNITSNVNVPLIALRPQQATPQAPFLGLQSQALLQNLLAIPTRDILLRFPFTVAVAQPQKPIKVELPRAFAYPPGPLDRHVFEGLLQELSMIAFTKPNTKEAEGFRLLHEKGLEIPSLGIIRVESGPYVDRLPMTYLKIERGERREYLPLYQHGRGVIKLIQLSVVLYSKEIVFIDEPENSLHPEAMAWMSAIITDASERGTKVIVSTQNYEFLRYLVLASVLYKRLKDVKKVARELSKERVDVDIDEFESAPVSIHLLCPPKKNKEITEITYSGKELVMVFERDLRKEFYYFRRCIEG